jgi:DNA-binding response OmpR family regulator
MPHLLVIDDDAAIRQVLSRLLVSEGFSVDAAADGEKGLVCVRTRPPDLILLDLMMPVMDGWQLYGWLQVSGYEQIPVIVMTAGERIELAQQDLPNAEVLGKPFDIDDLVERIRRRLNDNPAVNGPQHSNATA